MADELIQQVPKQGNYAIPGLLTGAAIGGIGGAIAANNGYGVVSKPDLDKVFAQKPDTFKRQIEKGGENKGAWETAQEWAKKIQDAEKEYDNKIEELKKGGNIATNIEELADTEQVKKDYKTAKSAYDTALNAEKSALSAANGTGSTEVKPFAELKGVKVPDGKTPAEFEAEYTRRFNEYKAAETALNSDPRYQAQQARVAKIEKAYTGAKDGIFTIADKAAANAIATSKMTQEEVLEHIFRNYEGDSSAMRWFRRNAAKVGIGNDPIYNQILETVKADVYPVPKSLTNSQLKELGDFVEETDSKKIASARRGIDKAAEEFIEIKSAKGNTVGYVIAQKGAKADALKAAQEAAVEEQKRIAGELLGQAREHAELKLQLNEVPKQFVENNKKMLEKAKLTTDASKIQAEIATLDKDVLESDLKALRKHGSSTNLTIEQAIADKYKVAGETSISFDEAIKRASKRLEAVNSYSQSIKEIEDKMKGLIENNAQLVEARETLQRMKMRNKKVSGAYNKLRELCPEQYAQGTGTKLSAEEIATQAAKNLENQKVATNLKAAEDAVNARLKELGKGGEMTTEEAIKKFGQSKEEFLKSIKEDGKKAVEPLLEKLKLPHAGKTALAAGLIAAVVGLGIGAASKKDIA